MMGTSHAATGAAAWVALTSPGAQLIGLPTAGTEVVLLGALTTAGAALISDWDHPRATISHALPPLSNLIAAGIQRISGGHRNGTHSLIGLAVFTLLALASTPLHLHWQEQNIAIGQGIVAAFLTTVAAKALKIIPTNSYLIAWAIGLAVGALAGVSVHDQWWWLPASVFLGVAVHILGDGLTVEGVPLLWPWKPKPPTETVFWRDNGRFAAPLVGRTGSWREWVLVTPITLYLMVTLSQATLKALPALDELQTIPGDL